jgi:hypothetical protein
VNKFDLQRKHIGQLEENIESLMKFPDLSLGEQEYHLAITSPQFDKAVQDYIKGNNLRILILEKKNEEYRKMRLQHGMNLHFINC